MANKLTYLSLYGLGEAIRYILHYNKEEFEDVWVDGTKWPIHSIKDALPYGQLPLYEKGDRKLNQSIAIARYIGHRAKLVPDDPWEQAVLDSAVLNIYDFVMRMRPYAIKTDPDKKKALLKECLEITVVYYFPRFEKELTEKNSLLTINFDSYTLLKS